MAWQHITPGPVLALAIVPLQVAVRLGSGVVWYGFERVGDA